MLGVRSDRRTPVGHGRWSEGCGRSRHSSIFKGRERIMAPEIGYFALLLALFVSVVQSATPFVAARRHDPTVAAFADQAALAQFMFLVVAFASLIYAFVTSDFSVEVVAANSHTAKPLLYKIAGVWGNHEGSMLLWV